ncbi:iron transporter [Natrinema marinum]|uniref:iron transporter n=1 Tax=Natrinema marinum TaxID=2961598 RepID=UPI0020C872A4|nr:iron transporter [Natrinema marinum]
MNRRSFLRGTAAAGAAGTVGLAGCLERLGFEEQSAWANPPLVEDRPDAVYLPASREEMGMYGMATDGDYAAMLTYTFPHRFWIVSGGKELVEVDTDDSLHLMFSLWDRKTETVLPVNTRLEILQDGSPVDIGVSSLWPMLSQRMGFHYGDNVRLPGEGEYTARITAGPVALERTGAFEDRLGSRATLEIDFEYARSDINGLSFETIDESERGSRDALPLMNHDGDDSGGRPMGRGTPVEDLPGELLGTKRSGDAVLPALASDAARFTDGGAYLAVSPRTPYNDLIVPFTSLSATVERDGSVVAEGALTETLDGEYGHHYGLAVDDLAAGDHVTITVDTPPQVARHDGYETAFFEFEPVTYTV